MPETKLSWLGDLAITWSLGPIYIIVGPHYCLACQKLINHFWIITICDFHNFSANLLVV